MSILNYFILFTLILAIVNCRPQKPLRYPILLSSSTTIKPTTTTTNSSFLKFKNHRPYNIYEGLDFILPMLGNTKPTTTTPSTTTALSYNPM